MYYRPLPGPRRSLVCVTRPTQPIHPSSNQLKIISQRYLFALDMDKAVNRVTTSCHHCASLRTVPTTVVKQSTNPPPETVGISFAAGVIKRAKQFILVLHECVTSCTVSSLLPNERHDTLRDALISLCIYELTPPLVSWPSTTAQSFTTTELYSRSAESRIERRPLLSKEQSKNLRHLHLEFTNSPSWIVRP